MDKRKRTNRLRFWVQLGSTLFVNGNVNGFIEGNIYNGPLKAYCVPGLNCYSCPGAFGACPVGALQSVLTGREKAFPFYVFGFLLAVGALFGRLICGWLCPFGLVQDLLYKIPFVKKLRTLPGEKALRCLRYVILVLFVILLPLLILDFSGQGLPWFCKYICPSGTLMGGVPLVAINSALRAAAGSLFVWKIILLALIILLSIIVFRPFCRYLCPLGAIYGLFNPISLYRYKVDTHACTSCNACTRACPFSIPTYKKPNSPSCIRCGKCKAACPVSALSSTFEIPRGAARKSRQSAVR